MASARGSRSEMASPTHAVSAPTLVCAGGITRSARGPRARVPSSGASPNKIITAESGGRGVGQVGGGGEAALMAAGDDVGGHRQVLPPERAQPPGMVAHFERRAERADQVMTAAALETGLTETRVRGGGGREQGLAL